MRTLWFSRPHLLPSHFSFLPCILLLFPSILFLHFHSSLTCTFPKNFLHIPFSLHIDILLLLDWFFLLCCHSPSLFLGFHKVVGYFDEHGLNELDSTCMVRQTSPHQFSRQVCQHSLLPFWSRLKMCTFAPRLDCSLCIYLFLLIIFLCVCLSTFIFFFSLLTHRNRVVD